MGMIRLTEQPNPAAKGMSRQTRLLVLLAVFSLALNGFLTWQWQAERQSFRDLLAVRNRSLVDATLNNRHLTAENQEIQEDLTAKDKELSDKVTQLAQKQNELNDLSKQLTDKKTELDQKTKQLSDAQKQIDNQKSQIDANAAELSKLRNRPPLFSFQVKSNSLSEAEAKKEAVKQIVSGAYDTIESVYGKPYLLHSVTITFVDNFTNDKASGEILITNSDKGLDLDIHLKDFDKNDFNDVNTVIHEVIHSFHGLAVLEPTGFEEGITVATTDIVMQKMIAAGTIPRFSPLYIRLSESEFNNYQNSLSIPANQSAFYGSNDVAKYYQVLGKAWYQLYQNDSSFFKNFNEKIYAKKNEGKDITKQLVLDTIKEVQPGANLSGAAWQLR